MSVVVAGGGGTAGAVVAVAVAAADIVAMISAEGEKVQLGRNLKVRSARLWPLGLR